MDWLYIGETKPIIVECKDRNGDVYPLQVTDTLTITLVRAAQGRTVKTAVLSGDGSDGLMQYTPQTGDFITEDAGDCRVQGKVERPGALTLFTVPQNINIRAPL
jgi:hypothetical protein